MALKGGPACPGEGEGRSYGWGGISVGVKVGKLEEGFLDAVSEL